MVKMNTGNYLRAKDARKGAIVKILDEGAWEKSEKFKNEDGSPVNQFIVNVEYEGEKRKLKFTKGSRVALIEAFGDESKNWIGKTARIMIVPTPNGNDKSILLDPIVEAQPDHEEEPWDNK